MKKLIMSVVCATVSFALLAAESSKLEVVTENYPPFNYLEDDRVVGISTEIVKRVLDETKIPYSIHLYPWTRAYSKAEQQDNVLIYTLTRTKEREDKFYWFVKLITPTFYIYAKKELEIPKDFKNLKAVCVREDAACNLFAKYGFSVEKENLSIVSDVEGSSEIKMVLANRVQLFICDSQSLSYRLKQLGLSSSDFKQVAKVKEGEGFYLGASKKLKPEYVKELKRAINRLKKNGKNLSII